MQLHHPAVQVIKTFQLSTENFLIECSDHFGAKIVLEVEAYNNWKILMACVQRTS